MTQTTYRATVLGSFLIPLLLLAFHLRSNDYAPKFQPDTQSYILSSPYRNALYPTFLNLVLQEDEQRSALQSNRPEGFTRVVAVQKGFFLLSVLFILIACHKLLSFSHLFIILLVLIFKKSATDLWTQVAWILPEGLSVSWMLLSIGLTLLTFASRSLRNSMILTVSLFVGILLSPRFICFLPLLAVLIPLKELKLKRALPVALMVLLLFAQCSYTLAKSNVFSLSPMGGIYTIGSALRFLTPDSLTHFSEPKARSFLFKAISAPDRRKEIVQNDWMTWTFATRIYRETFSEKFTGLTKGKDVLHMNAFYSNIFPRLFANDSELRQTWIVAGFRQLWFYLRFNLVTNIVLFGAALIALILYWRMKQAILILPLVFASTHLFNVLLTVPFCGSIDRYLTSTHHFQIFSLFIVGLYLWDIVADWALHQLAAFKRPSVSLETPSTNS